MNTLLIIMGVSGCGKSSVAQAIAAQLDYEYVEADDFHPQENQDHMASGLALSDVMREPWIARLQSHLKQSSKAGRNCVMSFSGLRRQHRAKIRELPFISLFIHLKGERSLIAERINARSNHFMPVALLDSQFSALEPPSENENIIDVNIDQTLECVVADSLASANHLIK